ncbi:flagellar motor protein [Allosphingosinicella vermicomposti]|uniref:flagellar motor protein n=1 Tax=Allosphingosinicella vermicomposti TaxID=614671 RepID=UPI00131A4A77|nr:flagellar motor protein [Allosphingosinicella vermicomposti]
MSQVNVPRWAMSLADLGLLLLGFFIILYTGKADVEDVARATRGAFGSEEEGGETFVVDAPADAFFEEGEARLTRDGRTRFVGIGRRAMALGRKVQIESVGRAEDAARFDGFELSAARAAAVARAVEEGGLAPERIEIAMPVGRDVEGQQLKVRAR